jgi:hypothetical protein
VVKKLAIFTQSLKETCGIKFEHTMTAFSPILTPFPFITNYSHIHQCLKKEEGPGERGGTGYGADRKTYKQDQHQHLYTAEVKYR